MIEVNSAFVKKCYPSRADWSKKHDFGYLAVVGGSNIYTGAPILAGLAALRAGSDLVYMVTPKNSFNAAVKYPEFITINLGTEFLSQMNEDAWVALSNSDALVIGNGITRRFEVSDTVNEILSQYSKPVVIDADALHFLSDLDIKSEDVIVTPHLSEFKIITGSSPETLEERIAACSEFANETGLVVLLKGHVDVIAGESKILLNKTGNAYMTKGGTGDMLAGICGALVSRGIDAIDAAACASYVSGLAGEFASEKFKEGTLPTDIIKEIPRAIDSSI
ncbi:MAG: NAD(P)H-hydrate dehydratase [Candidatus Altiarchaeota archaeon]|nr:NAD(P)H-hydrate dehydratase [Candidatus Altiarchaeota archaeon]